jgi:hypothetical protein
MHIGKYFRYVCLIIGVQIKHCDDTDDNYPLKREKLDYYAYYCTVSDER